MGFNKWDKITASSNWTYILVVTAIATVITIIFGSILASFYPSSLFISMPVIGLLLSLMGASYFQLKKIG